MAESRLRVNPIAPTSHTPITFHFHGVCETPISVTRAGSVITVLLDNSNPCNPPISRVFVMPLPEGTLPPGEYRADVAISILGVTTIKESFPFTVREDSPEQIFRVRPSAVSVDGGLPLRLESTGDEHICAPPRGCRVFIGGVERPVTSAFPNVINTVAPPHASGVVDVVIERLDRAFTAKAALYYFEPGRVPPESVFERILFPLLFEAPGANGSQWRTESSIDNPNPWFVETANVIRPIPCSPVPGAPCGQRIEPVSYQKHDGGVHPHGAALLVPRSEAPDLAFASRVRDVSKDADNFGSEISVVRERDLIAAGRPITLLDVPLDPRYRVKVRAYALDDRQTQMLYGVIRIVDPATKQERTAGIELTRACSESRCAWTPYFAEYDFPAPATASRVNLYVTLPFSDARTLAWAFAITNNTTQQVTIISPGHANDAAIARQ